MSALDRMKVIWMKKYDYHEPLNRPEYTIQCMFPIDTVLLSVGCPLDAFTYTHP